MSPFTHPGTTWQAMGTNLPTTHCRGATITELLVVVIILGLLAAVAAPGLRSADPAKLDLAATRVAEAIRYARSESMRTGLVHGVTIRHNNQQVLVRSYDLTTDPVSAIDTLHHPVTRQPLDFDFDIERPTQGVQITNSQNIFDYAGLGRRRTVLFNADGVPMWIVTSGPDTYNLATGIIELSLGNLQRTVNVAPYTGRVTIQ